MNYLLWIIVGGFIGWLASIIVGTDREQGVLLNIAVGIIGAFVGGMLFKPFIGDDILTTASTSATAILVSLFGAVIFLSVVVLIRRVVH